MHEMRENPFAGAPILEFEVPSPSNGAAEIR